MMCDVQLPANSKISRKKQVYNVTNESEKREDAHFSRQTSCETSHFPFGLAFFCHALAHMQFLVSPV